jgi:hypothetical protein
MRGTVLAICGDSLQKFLRRMAGLSDGTSYIPRPAGLSYIARRNSERYDLLMAARPKRPRDANQLGKLIADIATGGVTDEAPDAGKNPAAVASGRKGGLNGGKARAEKLTAEQRSAIARKAAAARWAAS